MRLLKKILPHLSIALSLTTVTVSIFNEFNPRMGFFQGRPVQVLMILACIASVSTAAIVIAEHFHDRDKETPQK